MLGHSRRSTQIPGRVRLLRVPKVTWEAYSLWLVAGMLVSVSCRQSSACAMGLEFLPQVALLLLWPMTGHDGSFLGSHPAIRWHCLPVQKRVWDSGLLGPGRTLILSAIIFNKRGICSQASAHPCRFWGAEGVPQWLLHLNGPCACQAGHV